MMHGIFHDWVPYAPLMITSIILLILYPFFSKNKKNALILLSLFVLPVVGLYSYCKLFNITHFITSRYFIGFLPLFFITIFLSLDSIEAKFETFRNFMRLKFLFIILLIVSNLVFFPLLPIREARL